MRSWSLISKFEMTVAGFEEQMRANPAFFRADTSGSTEESTRKRPEESHQVRRAEAGGAAPDPDKRGAVRRGAPRGPRRLRVPCPRAARVQRGARPQGQPRGRRSVSSLAAVCIAGKRTARRLSWTRSAPSARRPAGGAFCTSVHAVPQDLRRTDPGFAGAGIYATLQAEYAAQSPRGACAAL